MAHGPWDSATANGKWWIIEDDSRTALDPFQGNFKYALNGADSASLLKRNVLTALMHGHGIYFYDLNNQGYFGRPKQPKVTSEIWSGVSSAVQVWTGEINEYATHGPADSVAGVDTTAAHVPDGNSVGVGALVPEIAVFSDERSVARRLLIPAADLPMHSNPAYGAFDGMLLGDVLPVIAGTGAAVRAFQLTDLLLPGLDWTHFRLCIFLNAFVVTANVSAAIKTKLQHPNITLLWQYAPGLYSSVTGQPDPDRVSDIVGIPLRRGAGGIDLLTRLVNSSQAGVGGDSSFNALARRGLQYGHRGCCQQWPKQVDPWFYWSREDDPGPAHDPVELLGVLQDANLSVGNSAAGGLVRTTHRATGHTSVFTAAPGLPVTLWRSLAEAAGVHMFTTLQLNASLCKATNDETWLDALTDSVELHGSSLLYHAAATCDGSVSSQRHVSLPVVAVVVIDEMHRVVCSNCKSFWTPPMAAGDVLSFRIQGVSSSQSV